MTLSRRRRRTRNAVFVTVIALVALGLNTMSASAGATNIKSLFELDGNAVVDAGGAPDDWANVLLPPSGDNGSIANSGVIVDPKGETIYATGASKDDLDNDGWRHSTGSVPDKDEITNAYAAAYSGTGGELILYFGADRFATNGNANLGFWFFQNDVAPAPDGTFSGTPHTVGDLLILSTFTNGGVVPFIQIYEWVGSGGDTNGTLDLVGNGADCSTASATATACATVNGTNQTSPWPYTPKTGAANIFKPGAFFEGGVNVSDLFGAQLPCFSSFIAETRSSQSVDATLKDFTGGNFPLCGANISISPDAVNEVGDDHTFTVTVNQTVAGANSPAPDGTIVDVDLTDANGAVNDVSANTCANPGTSGGTCSITFTSDTAGTVTAHAEADVQVSDSLIHVETDGAGANGSDKVKRFVDARVSIDPDDTNSIGESHTFTVDADQDDGLTAAQGGDGVTGFAPATVGDAVVTLTNSDGAANSVSANTCDIVAGDGDDDLDSNGRCTVTFTSASSGTVTGHATVTVTVAGLSITRSTDATGSNSNDAVKVFVDGSLTWIKQDNQGNRMSANFEVCRTHNLNTGTGLMEAITAICVSVSDNVAPDTDPSVGGYKLEDLRLGRYTVDEVAPFPPGFEPDPDVETVDLTLASPNGSVSTPFVNVALFKLIVLTCNEVTEELVDSTVVMDTDPGAGTNNVTKETLKSDATLPDGVSQGELCGLDGANYGNLVIGQYNPSVELPDRAPLFP